MRRIIGRSLLWRCAGGGKEYNSWGEQESRGKVFGGNLQRAGGGGGGGPGPLEVKPAQMAGDVDDFADEEKAGNETGFHGFTGEFARVDTAGSDFCFFVAFRSCGRDAPGV